MTTPRTDSLSVSLREEASRVSVSAPYGRPLYVDLMRDAADELERLNAEVERQGRLWSTQSQIITALAAEVPDDVRVKILAPIRALSLADMDIESGQASPL